MSGGQVDIKVPGLHPPEELHLPGNDVILVGVICFPGGKGKFVELVHQGLLDPLNGVIQFRLRGIIPDRVLLNPVFHKLGSKKKTNDGPQARGENEKKKKISIATITWKNSWTEVLCFAGVMGFEVNSLVKRFTYWFKS